MASKILQWNAIAENIFCISLIYLNELSSFCLHHLKNWETNDELSNCAYGLYSDPVTVRVCVRVHVCVHARTRLRRPISKICRWMQITFKSL